MRLQALRGNEPARRGLMRALGSSRIPHALLLHGPDGVGKNAAARALAQALMCPNADPDSCDACNVCRRVVDGIHPDVMVVEPDGQFVRIDAIRTVTRSAHHRSFEGGPKVFIFPRAECFSEVSANALLKTLEEPPDHTHLILITTSREAVLTTLRSRCQSVPFLPLARSDVRALLSEEGYSDDEADHRARLAAGSIPRARAVDLAQLRAMEDRTMNLLLALASGPPSPAITEKVIKFAEELASKNGPLRQSLFEVLRPIARDALLIASGGDSRLLVTDCPERIEKLAQLLGPDGATSLLHELAQAEDDLVINANKKLLVEALLLGVFVNRSR